MVEKIGKYRIVRLVGTGTTSSVYLAVDDFNGREVAIKLADHWALDTSSLGRRYQEMVLNEVALAGRLDHPHIVHLLDAGIYDEDRLYVVMEYVKGSSLKDYARPDALLGQLQVLEMLIQCVNALGYAAEKGVFHRDIKPANLLCDEQMRIKIADFGAAFLQYLGRNQDEVSFLGTPAFLAPEIIREEPWDLRSDIYALGVTLYQLLTGCLPYVADSAEALFELILQAPLIDFPDRIPEPCVPILRSCLAKDKADRFADWAALEAALMQAHQVLAPKKDAPSYVQQFVMLRGLTFFCELGDRELWELLSIASWLCLPAEHLILEEGAKGNSLYFVVSGSARVVKAGRVIDQIDPGFCLGELAYILGENLLRTASVISNTPIQLIKFRAESLGTLSDLLQSSVKCLLLCILAQRLERTTATLS